MSGWGCSPQALLTADSLSPLYGHSEHTISLSLDLSHYLLPNLTTSLACIIMFLRVVYVVLPLCVKCLVNTVPGQVWSGCSALFSAKYLVFSVPNARTLSATELD